MRALYLALCVLLGSTGARAADTLVIGNDLAEIVERLDAASRLVGRDDSSRYPAEIARLPSVGYLRQLSAEGMLALKPRRVLISDAARPAIVLQQLRGVGLEVISVARGKGIGDIEAKIHTVAEAMDRRRQSPALIEEQRRLIEALGKQPPLKGPKALYLFNRAGMTPLVMGRGTEANAVLEQAGIENSATFDAYKQVAAEAMVSLAPDFVIISQAGLQALGGEDSLWKLGGLAHTPAGQHRRLVLIDDQALLSLGPRTVQAMLQLRRDAGALFP
ncbi:hemin ABC transporter substrate-binding protein [Pseudomonas sp. NPDC090755]|uniref:heme/hemin ABC transporter substrate-binding protein n=1 Tax=Pseudomonas sp. NPDC090755 TaxID=3364481 RepID=UPI00383B37B3